MVLAKKVTLDPAAEATMALANFEAGALASLSIQPIHVFSAMLKVLDGVFANEAQRIGLDADVIEATEEAGRNARAVTKLSDEALTDLRRRVWKTLVPTHTPPVIKRLPLATRTSALIQSAAALTTAAGQAAVSLSFLVQAMFQNPPTDVRPHLFPGEGGAAGTSQLPQATTVDLAGGAVGRDLTALARAGRLERVVGRRNEIKALARFLHRTSKRNVLLLGEAGVGKTALVEGLAQWLADPAAPEFLANVMLVQIEVASLIADTAHRGDLEQRLQKLIEQAEKDANLVLFIDEIHLIVGAGAARGALDVANLLKSALARDGVRCIGATTTDEFERHIKPDAALLRRFQILRVPEPDQKTAIEMCRSWARRLEERQEVVFEDEAIEASVTLSSQLIHDRSLPDKAIDLLENAAAATKIASLSFERMAPTKELPRIGRAQIERVLAEQYGVSVSASQAIDAKAVQAALAAALVGQDEAIAVIGEALEDSRRRPPTPRPLAVLLFVGPTGVGKTSAAETLAQAAFGGTAPRLGRFNMSELKSLHELARLVGAPPGFIGHDRQGALFEFTERNPQGVILLDEMDKAHPEVQDYFLQIFDQGEAADSRGRKVAFNRYIFVATCNEPAGATAAVGFVPDADAGRARRLELTSIFRREFIARFDAIVPFRALEERDYEQLLDRLIASLTTELRAGAGAEVRFDPAARRELVTLCRVDDSAREFLRRFERLVRTPLARALESGATSPLDVSVRDGRVQIGHA